MQTLKICTEQTYLSFSMTKASINYELLLESICCVFLELTHRISCGVFDVLIIQSQVLYVQRWCAKLSKWIFLWKTSANLVSAKFGLQQQLQVLTIKIESNRNIVINRMLVISAVWNLGIEYLWLSESVSFEREKN